MAQKNPTVLEFLEDVAGKDSSSEKDARLMETFLRRNLGFEKAVVTCGIVYLDGHGTLEAPPTSIHTIAKHILKSIKPVVKEVEE